MESNVSETVYLKDLQYNLCDRDDDTASSSLETVHAPSRLSQLTVNWSP